MKNQEVIEYRSLVVALLLDFDKLAMSLDNQLAYHKGDRHPRRLTPIL